MALGARLAAGAEPVGTSVGAAGAVAVDGAVPVGSPGVLLTANTVPTSPAVGVEETAAPVQALSARAAHKSTIAAGAPDRGVLTLSRWGARCGDGAANADRGSPTVDGEAKWGACSLACAARTLWG